MSLPREFGPRVSRDESINSRWMDAQFDSPGSRVCSSARLPTKPRMTHGASVTDSDTASNPTRCRVDRWSTLALARAFQWCLVNEMPIDDRSSKALSQADRRVDRAGGAGRGSIADLECFGEWVEFDQVINRSRIAIRLSDAMFWFLVAIGVMLVAGLGWEWWTR